MGDSGLGIIRTSPSAPKEAPRPPKGRTLREVRALVDQVVRGR